MSRRNQPPQHETSVPMDPVLALTHQERLLIGQHPAREVAEGASMFTPVGLLRGYTLADINKVRELGWTRAVRLLETGAQHEGLIPKGKCLALSLPPLDGNNETVENPKVVGGVWDTENDTLVEKSDVDITKRYVSFLAEGGLPVVMREDASSEDKEGYGRQGEKE